MVKGAKTTVEPSLAMLPPTAPTVNDIAELQLAGPWSSKSGGHLSVPFALPYAEAKRFLEGDPSELARMPEVARGLRMFVVENMPVGGVGGGEFHRNRSEIIFTMCGKLSWSCEDLYGSTRVFEPSRERIIRIPPFILHTMRAEEDGSAIMVIANTLFDADDVRTQDSHPAAQFRELQKQMQLREAVSRS